LHSIPFSKKISHNILLDLVGKTNQTYVFPLLNECYCVTGSFDLWMSKGAHDVFALVINFFECNWKPKQMTFGLFEDVETIGQALARNLIDLLDAYGLRNKIITYVKDEGSNLNTLTNALKFVVKCEALGLEESFQGTYFGHVFSKAYQYVTTNEIFCRSLNMFLLNLPRKICRNC
jgi:hypothetical protein